MASRDPDSLALRNALGQFPTGVTVVTAPDVDNDRFVGVTVNSFNAVSLEPPLVVWSLDRDAQSLEVFERSGCFVVNVLGADQAEISRHFARKRDDKFETVEVETGVHGAPLLEGCVARFQCRTERVLDGGDHVMFVGRVTDFDSDPDRAPLVFHRGSYSRLLSGSTGPHDGP